MRNSLLLAIALSACSPTSADIVTVTTTVPDVIPTEPVAVVGLDITKVSIYQGVEVILFEENDEFPPLQMPIVRKRDARVRVFFDPKANWQEREIEAILEIEDGNGDTTELVKTRNIKKTSEDSLMGSTINFDVSGDLISLNTKFHLKLWEADVTQAWEGNSGKVSWNSGTLDSQKTGEINIVLLPVKYNADGSGRLPDTSQSQLDRIHDLMMGMYPATEVNLTVGETVNWNDSVGAFSSNGWSNLLYEISDRRDADRSTVSANTYYYGLFNPATSINSYCQQGCILGLSNLAYNTTTPWLRSSIGLGFTGSETAETLVHEVGHAHGREHAPCGLGGQSSDPQYPYSNANLGSWGYNILTQELMAPDSRSDMMSYCSPTWVSDYQFYNLYLRIQNLAAQSRASTIPYQTIQVTENGNARLSKVREFSPDQAGEYIDVTLLDGFGTPLEVVQGEYMPLSHLDGGLIRIPPVGVEVQGVRVPSLED